MPPVTKAGGSEFRKDVEFVTKDDDEQTAAGIVMVPDKADLQHDFAREDTIRGFADQFETFEEAGEAGGGIMHAVWPDGWMSLERNEVLDEAEEIGGQTVDAGAWVQEWRIDNADLWSLIEDGILEGYSIGAIQVGWDGPHEQDDVDVDTSEIPDGDLVWELTDGIIREVSAVDIPAVPDAQILEVKALEKRLAEHIGNPDAFLAEAQDRGHSEAEAQQLWDVLNEAMETDGASEPGKQSMLHRAGKAFLSALSGTDDGADDTVSPEAPGREKEGRTLSQSNRDSLYATIDASLDVLEDAGVDHGMTRFTDRDDVGFDLTAHQAREWAGDHPEDEGEDDEDEEESETENAAGGDTPDDNTAMSDTDTDDPLEDAPEWARTLHDSIRENSKRLDEQNDQIEAALEAQEEEKTAQIEIDGEVYEVTESEAKSWFEDGETPDADPMADAPDYVRALDERVEEVNQRIERINQQSGRSDQLDAASSGTGGRNGAGDDEDGLKALSDALS